jgi:hypothetical protein
MIDEVTPYVNKNKHYTFFEHALPYFLSNDRILVYSTLHFIVLYVIRICKFKIWSLDKSFIFLFILF